MKVYEALRERVAMPGRGDISAEVDDFGLDQRYLERARSWLDWLFDTWWRVEVSGIEARARRAARAVRREHARASSRGTR